MKCGKYNQLNWNWQRVYVSYTCIYTVVNQKLPGVGKRTILGVNVKLPGVNITLPSVIPKLPCTVPTVGTPARLVILYI